MDAPMFVVPRMLDALRAWHASPKLADLPVDAPGHAGMVAELDRLGARLLDGITAHPTRFWTVRQIQRSLEAVRGDTVQARTRFGQELARVMAILGIEDVEGLIDFYLRSH
jgi:hypothetical protein